MTSTDPPFANRSGLGDRLWQFFQQRRKLQECPPQTELYRQAEAVNDICLIKTGLVKLAYANKQGRAITVALRFPGAMLGAAAVLSDHPAPTSVVTLAPSRICCLAVPIFLQAVATDLGLANEVVRAISQNFYEQTLHLARLGTHHAPGRVAQLLLQFIPTALPQPSGELRFQLTISHAEAGKLLAMTREHFTRTLGQLEKVGIIRQNNGWIYVSNLELLSHTAEIG